MNASQQMAARRYRIERYLTEGGMGAIYIGKKLGPGGFEKEVQLFDAKLAASELGFGCGECVGRGGEADLAWQRERRDRDQRRRASC